VLDDQDDLTLYPMQKAIACTALAQLRPGERQALAARAGKLNYALEHPHHFLAEALKRMK